MSNDTYEAVAKRSVGLDDVRDMVRAADRLLAARDHQDQIYVDSIEVTVGSVGGYIIGTLWWDSETERYMLDFARYGESS